MLYDIVSYNDILAADSYELVKNARFTDVYTVENIVVQYVESRNFWDDPRMVMIRSLALN